MSEQLPLFVLLCPFFMAIAVSVLALWKRSVAQPLSVLALAGSLYFSIELLLHVIANGPVEYRMGGWDPTIGISLWVDTLSACVVVVIAAVALLAMVASRADIANLIPEKIGGYYPLALLFVTGVLGMTLTGDAFNLYVLIEVCSLTSYALIAQGQKRASHASFNYLILGMVGACFYLLGVGYLLVLTGTLNMHELHIQIRELGLMDSPTLHVGFVLIIVGLFIKMALFPLHGWLPNAYSYCPHTSSNLIAPLMTKVSVYVMARMMLTVFGLDYVLGLPWAEGVVVLASVAVLAGALLALGQRNLRKMLCYLVVSEVGYMVGGLWSGTHMGMSAALYHIVADAAMTACLFIAVMLITHKARSEDRSAFAGKFATMPVTMAVFVIGAFSMMGIPPTCGFFSKWYLIGGAFEAGQWYFGLSLIGASLLGAVLFFRLIEIAFMGEKPADTHGHAHEDDHAHSPKLDEAPAHQLIPAVLLGVSMLVIGLYSTDIIQTLDITLLPYLADN